MGKDGSEEDMLVVLITGCSKGGMGHALAVAFAEAEGARCIVIATARSLDAMEGLNVGHPDLHLVELDVCSDASIQEAVAPVLEKHGRIDILVNNAGMHCVAPVAELPLPLLQRTFDTNVTGPGMLFWRTMYMTSLLDKLMMLGTYSPKKRTQRNGALRMIQAVVGGMISRGKGKIVNIGSVTAFANGPWVGGYGASKAALHALSDSLRVELAPFGVQVVIVAPCAIRSNIGVNSSKIYSTLPNWKFYGPWKSAIEARSSASQLAKSTSASEFAQRTVREILKESPPRNFTIGYLSGFYTALYYLPLQIRDWIMKRYFGVKDLKHKD